MKVNGNEILLQKPMNLEEFLESLNYDVARIAVERNGDIVPKANYKKVILTEADTLEIVSFVGGG